MEFTIRNIGAYFVSYLLILSGKVRKINNKASNSEIILSVYFHNPTRKLFESTVKWFIKNKYKFISVEDLNEILKSEIEFPKSTVVFTVDDGWKDNKINIVSIANKYKVPVTIFATTDPIEKEEGFWWSYISKGKSIGLIKKTVNELKIVPNSFRIKNLLQVKSTIKIDREALTIEELKEISSHNNIIIGSHTISHPILTKCSTRLVEYELKESKNILEKWINKPIKSFAYPNGEFKEREIEILKRNGYEIAFSTKQKYLTTDNRNQRFSIPRFDVLENVSFTENICRMTGVWFYRK